MAGAPDRKGAGTKSQIGPTVGYHWIQIHKLFECADSRQRLLPLGSIFALFTGSPLPYPDRSTGVFFIAYAIVRCYQLIRRADFTSKSLLTPLSRILEDQNFAVHGVADVHLVTVVHRRAVSTHNGANRF